MLKAEEWPKTSRKQRSGGRLQQRRAMLRRSSTSVLLSSRVSADRSVLDLSIACLVGDRSSLLHRAGRHSRPLQSRLMVREGRCPERAERRFHACFMSSTEECGSLRTVLSARETSCLVIAGRTCIGAASVCTECIGSLCEVALPELPSAHR